MTTVSEIDTIFECTKIKNLFEMKPQDMLFHPPY